MTYTIEKIKVKKKQKSHFDVLLSSETGQQELTITVHEDVLVARALHKGMILTQEDVGRLENEAARNKAYQAAVRYLSYRMRTVQEMRVYLAKKGFEADEIESCVGRLRDENLLDDKAFAASFVRSKKRTAKKGPLLLKKELTNKGVDEQDSAKALSDYSWEEQVELTQSIANKLWQSSDGRRSGAEKRRKIQDRLTAKGFTQSAIHEALSLLEERNKNDEWEALKYQGDKALRKYQNKYEGQTLKLKVKQALHRKGFQLALIDRYLEDAIDNVYE